MQPEKSTPRSAPTWMANGCVSLCRSIHDSAPSDASSTHIHTERRYIPEKQRMNVSRYAVSGTIHSSGTTATFWQTSLVTASSKPVPVSDKTTHIPQSPARSGEYALPTTIVSILVGSRHTCAAAQAQTAQKNTNPADQNHACARIESSRS